MSLYKLHDSQANQGTSHEHYDRVCAFHQRRDNPYATNKNGVLARVYEIFPFQTPKKTKQIFCFDSPGLKAVATRYLGFDYGRGIEMPYESQPSNLIQRTHRRFGYDESIPIVGWFFLATVHSGYKFGYKL